MIAPESSTLYGLGFLLQSFTALFALLIRLAQHRHNTRSEATQKSIQKTGEDTHVLVNNKYDLALSLAARALRRVATLTGNPEDHEAAIDAEQAAAEHAQRQQVLDDHKASLK